ncbi:unnamed protein product, partial [Amoebophrya sp. A120]
GSSSGRRSGGSGGPGATSTVVPGSASSEPQAGPGAVDQQQTGAAVSTTPGATQLSPGAGTAGTSTGAAGTPRVGGTTASGPTGGGGGGQQTSSTAGGTTGGGASPSTGVASVPSTGGTTSPTVPVGAPATAQQHQEPGLVAGRVQQQPPPARGGAHHGPEQPPARVGPHHAPGGPVPQQQQHPPRRRPHGHGPLLLPAKTSPLAHRTIITPPHNSDGSKTPGRSISMIGSHVAPAAMTAPIRLAQPESLCEHFETVWDRIRKSPSALEHASEACRDSFPIVLEAVRFEEVPKATGTEKESQEALRVFGLLRFASTRLQDHGDIVFPAVKHVAHNLEFASPRLRDDENLVAIAVTAVPAMLEFASERLRGNRDVLRSAIDNEDDSAVPGNEGRHGPATSRDCVAMRFASSELQRDRELGLAAVRRCGRALRHLDFELRDDDEVCREAIARNRTALEFTSERFRQSYYQAQQEVATLAWVVTGVAIFLAALAVLVAVVLVVQCNRNKNPSRYYDLQDSDLIPREGSVKVKFDVRRHRFFQVPNEHSASNPVRKGKHRKAACHGMLPRGREQGERKSRPYGMPTASQPPANDRGGRCTRAAASSAVEEAPAGKEPVVLDAPQASARRSSEIGPVLEFDSVIDAPDIAENLLEGQDRDHVDPGDQLARPALSPGPKNRSPARPRTHWKRGGADAPGGGEAGCAAVPEHGSDNFPPASAARFFLPGNRARKQTKAPCSKAGPPPPVQTFRTVEGVPARVRVYEAADEKPGEENIKGRPAQGRCYIITMKQGGPAAQKKISNEQKNPARRTGTA